MNKVVQPPPEFFGRTIFSEDIRQEKSGQLTIVGMFPGGIDIESYPAVLPKMAMLVEFQWRREALKEPARLAAFMPGASADEPIWQEALIPPEIDPSSFEKIAAAEAEGVYPGELISRGTHVVVMANLTVSRPGMLQVRAFVGDKIFAIGGAYFSQKEDKAEKIPSA